MPDVRMTQRGQRSPPDHRRAFHSSSELATAHRVAAQLARLVPPPAFLTPRQIRLLPWLTADLTYAQSVFNVDVPMIMGVVLFSAVIVVGANLGVDLAYRWIDPPIQVA